MTPHRRSLSPSVVAWSCCLAAGLVTAGCSTSPDAGPVTGSETSNEAPAQPAATTAVVLPQPTTTEDLLGRILPPSAHGEPVPVYAKGGAALGQKFEQQLELRDVAGDVKELSVIFACSGSGTYQVSVTSGTTTATPASIDCASKQYIRSFKVPAGSGKPPVLRATASGDANGVGAYAVIPVQGEGLGGQ